MKNFKLKSLIVSGGFHTPSRIDFVDGFNLIIGPSNTGKSLITDCIDYIFGFTPKKGSPSKIVDNSQGYEEVTLVINSDDGELSLTRKIGTNSIDVSSSNPRIRSGKYKVGNTQEQNISDVFLALMGINEKHLILKNQNGELRSLTWRTFLHLFLMKQDAIGRSTSALYSPGGFGNTPSEAAILFLLTGRDQSNFRKSENPEISKAKRKALIEYMTNRRTTISERLETLEKELESYDIKSVSEIISSTREAISHIRSEIDKAMGESKSLLNEIYQKTSKLTECKVVIQSFHTLKKQYTSDIERIELIVNGHIATVSSSQTCTCPLCNSEIKKEIPPDYLKAAKSELDKISIRMLELEKALKSAEEQKDSIQSEIDTLINKKDNIDNLINKELTPKLNAFQQELSRAIALVQKRNEEEILKQELIQYDADIFKKETEEDSKETPTKVISLFPPEIMKIFNSILKETFTEAKIGGAEKTTFNQDKFDIEINGINKPSCMGGGFSAVLNALITFSLQTLLLQHGKYSPGFYIVDSALTQLSEAEHIDTLNTIKYNFMNFLIRHSSDRQVIVIEQKDHVPQDLNIMNIPGINVIEFTSDTNHGRYGFLNDVYKPEDINN